MRVLDAGRFLGAVVFAGTASAAACGGSGDSTNLFVPAHDGSASDDAGDDAPTITGDSSITGDSGGVCTPKKCSDLGYTCGMNGDGCGGVVDCGTCTAPQYCGGGGYSKCGGNTGFQPDGAPSCTPQTCASLGIDCGPAGDGCGGLIQSCGTCSGTDICGGGGPGVCGSGLQCVNLCKQQVKCDGGLSTTITGRVVAGTLPQYGNADPVPNVLVYVPNSPIQPFTAGVQCGCPQATGDPLVYATTAVDGTFTLTNMPAGSSIPLVIQLGRWRRQISIPSVPACTSSAVGDVHMPRDQSEGDIPLTAISTGQVDPIECVLLKMGVSSAEFTDPSGAGRMHVYQGNGARASNATPQESALTSSLPTMKNYDEILLPCWGQEVIKSAGDQANLESYGDVGGRIFATHFSYTWLFQNNPYSTTASWNVNGGFFNQDTGQIDTGSKKGQTFAQWMQLIGALTNTSPPQFDVTNPRHDFDAVNAPGVRWVYATQNGSFPLHYTFDTPLNASPACGRVIYSDFHVTNSSSSGQILSTCPPGAMTPQEKALEYMLWDLASCVGSQVPQCVPLTCQQQNISCGPAGDGCGGLIKSCGTCSGNQTCGGGGKNGQCGYPDGGKCAPQTCQQLGIGCGPAGDGCGGLLSCGTCSGSQTCGGGGTPGQCGGGTQ